MKHIIIIALTISITFELRAQSNVGIGINSPTSKLHIHEVMPDEVSNLQITNFLSGTTASDGLIAEQNGSNSSLLNQEFGNLSLGANNNLRLHLIADGNLGYNTTSSIGSSDFVLRSNHETSFGGMYIDSPNSIGNGKPFYGYALDGDIALYHYFDAVDGRFRYQFGNQSNPTFSFGDNGNFLLNATEAINTSTDLTIRSKNPTNFGGMYIDSGDTSTGKPFYGYAIDGVEKAFHYYDAETNNWILYQGSGTAMAIDDQGNVGLSTTDLEEKLVINGRLKLKASSTTSAADGTIVYNGANIYARINNSWWKMTNATAGQLTSDTGNDTQKSLKEENADLENRLRKMEEQLALMQEKLAKL